MQGGSRTSGSPFVNWLHGKPQEGSSKRNV